MQEEDSKVQEGKAQLSSKVSFWAPHINKYLPCICGISILEENFNKHLKSNCHFERLEKLKYEDQMGGVNGLISCSCGLFVNRFQESYHRRSDLHQRFEN